VRCVVCLFDARRASIACSMKMRPMPCVVRTRDCVQKKSHDPDRAAGATEIAADPRRKTIGDSYPNECPTCTTCIVS